MRFTILSWCVLLVAAESSTSVLQGVSAAAATTTTTKPRKIRGTRRLDHIPIESRIVGGSQSDLGAYPFFVEWNGCGASLIHEDIILSAAHCAGITSQRVVIGSYKTGDINVGDAESLRIVERRSHPNYNDATVENDFLVMKLNRASSKPPVAINADSNHPQNGDTLTVMGFGTLEEGGLFGSDYLQEVNVKYVEHESCNAKYDGEIVEDVMFCAGVPNGGRDSCQGDSGGPIIDENGVQVGVVSWGIGCGRRNYPGVYSRISGAIDWINDQICDLSDNPPSFCSGSGNGSGNGGGGNNGDETDPVPSPPSGDVVPVQVSLTLDDYPLEVGLEIRKSNNNNGNGSGSGRTVAEYPAGSFTTSGAVLKTINMEPGLYVLELTDTYGDGLCCTYGSGGLSVRAILPPDDSIVVLASSDGIYGDSIQIEFEVPAIPQDDSNGGGGNGSGNDSSPPNPPNNGGGGDNNNNSDPLPPSPPFEDPPVGSNCDDKLDTEFPVDAAVGNADCSWLRLNIDRYNYLCQFLDVAATCPYTCEACEYFQQ